MKSAAHHQGLSEQQVLENRTKYGVNILTPPVKEPLWKQFLEKFSDPIIKILLVALLLSVGVACYQFFTGAEPASVFLEPVGILVAILLATCVGFAFEVSANKKFEILNQVNDETMVQVIRGGNICELPRRDVVVGDIVILNTGEEVPADGVLLEAVSLQVNESTLTGEPLIGKTTNEAEFKKDATYPSNHVLKGTTVADGHGIMEVTSVGDRTEYGKVYEGSQIDNKVQTPLNRQLSRLGDLITWASYAIAALIIIGRLTLYFSHLDGPVEWLAAGTYILNTLMIAVTVIVVTVPEGLPMSVTLSLALSMKSMLANNNLVRKMHACETMGAATVICTDKTGTLTRNQMNVYKADFYGLGDAAPADGELGNLIREGIAVNSTAFLDYADPEHIKALGNPTEGALLLWLHGLGVNYLDLRENARVQEQLTFSTERKYMATVVESPLLGKKVLYVKGAPEIVLGLCSTVLTPEGQVPAADMRPAIEEQLLAYQNQAMRTLGFAYRILDDDAPVFEDGRVIRKDLVYLGIAAISDPVRDDVPQAVKDCMDAGINIKIVTGDTPGTAREIGRQIGLWTEADTPDRLMTGVEFEQTPDAELLDRVMDLKIMCRARPMDKERLVKLLQKKDQVVAVTGDGTNDAPPPERRAGGPLHGGRHYRSQGGQRHHHPGQFLHEHFPRRHVGTLPVPEYPALHRLPDDHQRGGLPHCAHRRVPGHGIPPHGHADALGQPHHGYLRRAGPGLPAAGRTRDAGSAAQDDGPHHHPPHGQEHSGRGHPVRGLPVRPAAILQACGRHQPHAVQPQRLLRQLPGLLLTGA